MPAQFLLRDRNGTTITDLSTLARGKKCRRRFGRPGWATCEVPSHLVGAGIAGATTLYCTFPEYGLFHNGIVITAEDQAEEDEYWTKITAFDPVWWWQHRVVEDADGDYSKPTILTDNVTAPAIMQAAINNTIANEGAIGATVGTVATGGANVTGANVDWPIRISDLAAMLQLTGELDIVCNPVNSGSTYGQVSFYNGNYGSDLSGSVVFSYGTGSYNCRGMRKVDDFSTICNALRYFLGPKIDDQHWSGNITRDDTALPDYAAMIALTDASRAAYGKFVDVRIIDADYVVAVEMYRYQWQVETVLRRKAKEMVYADLDHGVGLGTFDIGDKVGISAGPMLRGGFSGSQRVYGYTVAEDEDGVRSIEDLETSADQE